MKRRINRVCAEGCPHGGELRGAECRCEEYYEPMRQYLEQRTQAMIDECDRRCDEQCPGDGVITVNTGCRCAAYVRRLSEVRP